MQLTIKALLSPPPIWFLHTGSSCRYLDQCFPTWVLWNVRGREGFHEAIGLVLFEVLLRYKSLRGEDKGSVGKLNLFETISSITFID